MRMAGHWVHDLDPYLIHFPSSWPFAGIHWYGVAYALAFSLALALAHLCAAKDRLPIARRDVDRWLGALCLGVLAGGRLGYFVLYERSTLVHDPLELFRIWHGGMASHGGFVGVALALFFLSRRRRISLLSLADLSAAAAPIGFFLGRLGNFINGEVYGRPTALPWGIIFPRSAPHAQFPLALLPPRHPSQLYEALLEGIVLLALTQWRLWTRRGRPGQLTGEFFIAYALLRSLAEFLREPDAPLILHLTAGQFYSIPLAVAGIAILCRGR
ncbi:MAG: prolipoprotein diacylglyceryl transferase [Puniceicoccales bacterium]|jgi:phosphatidylglycerol:prolipoprotein diacylglycerol transferase|nr:prolipoprotein diacylglyceryl transferase [Puniceicoccales bacterium]